MENSVPNEHNVAISLIAAHTEPGKPGKFSSVKEPDVPAMVAEFRALDFNEQKTMLDSLIAVGSHKPYSNTDYYDPHNGVRGRRMLLATYDLLAEVGDIADDRIWDAFATGLNSGSNDVTRYASDALCKFYGPRAIPKLAVMLVGSEDGTTPACQGTWGRNSAQGLLLQLNSQMIEEKVLPNEERRELNRQVLTAFRRAFWDVDREISSHAIETLAKLDPIDDETLGELRKVALSREGGVPFESRQYAGRVYANAIGNDERSFLLFLVLLFTEEKTFDKKMGIATNYLTGISADWLRNSTSDAVPPDDLFLSLAQWFLAQPLPEGEESAEVRGALETAQTAIRSALKL
jgi:hypothetical protein